MVLIRQELRKDFGNSIKLTIARSMKLAISIPKGNMLKEINVWGGGVQCAVLPERNLYLLAKKLLHSCNYRKKKKGMQKCMRLHLMSESSHAEFYSMYGIYPIQSMQIPYH